MKTFCTYLRVSTQQQGRSMLGISAQRKMCEDFIAHNEGVCNKEFVDIESGTHRNRKGLQDAISYCKKNDCALVIAKLDRLARDVEFCFKIINTGIEIHFTDMPLLNTLLLGVFASVAQYERELTSDRTKKALAVKKAQGAKLGAANENYRATRARKDKEQIKQEHMKKGRTKNLRHLESPDVKAFFKVLRNVFPKACADKDPLKWNWAKIHTKDGTRQKVLRLMADYKDFDDTLFRKWDFTDIDSTALQIKLAKYIYALRRSINTYKEHKTHDYYEQ